MKRRGKSPNKPAEGEANSARRASAKKVPFGCPCRFGCEPLPGFDPSKSKKKPTPKKREE